MPRHPRRTPVFGGADFGAGFWDLVAGRSDRGRRPREVIDHSIAPVWEANHVWLIFTFVVLYLLDQKGLLPEEGVPDQGRGDSHVAK